MLKILLSLLFFHLPWQTQWIFRYGVMLNSPWEYGTVGVYGTDVLILIIALMLGCCVWRTQRIMNYLPCQQAGELRIKEIKSKIKTVIHDSYFLILFVFWNFLSILWSVDKLVALTHALWILEVVVLVAMIIQMKFYRRVMVGAFIVGVIFQALVGIIQFALQTTWVLTIMGWAFHDPAQLGTSVIETELRRWLRAYGGLPHPNIFGGYVVAGLMFLLASFKNIEDRLRLWLENNFKLRALIGAIGIWLGYFLCIIALLFSFSRSAWIAFGLFLFFWSIHNRKQWPQVIKILCVTFIVVVMVIFVFREPFQIRSQGQSRLEVKAVNERLIGMGDSITLIKRNPLLGVGLGNFTNALPKIDLNPKLDSFTGERLDKKAWDYQPVHNVPLLIVSELGLVGFILLLLALWNFFRSWELGVGSRGCKEFMLHNSYFIIPILPLLLFDHYLWSLHVGLLLFGVMIGFWLTDEKVV